MKQDERMSHGHIMTCYPYFVFLQDGHVVCYMCYALPEMKVGIFTALEMLHTMLTKRSTSGVSRMLWTNHWQKLVGGEHCCCCLLQGAEHE